MWQARLRETRILTRLSPGQLIQAVSICGLILKADSQNESRFRMERESSAGVPKGKSLKSLGFASPSGRWAFLATELASNLRNKVGK